MNVLHICLYGEIAIKSAIYGNFINRLFLGHGQQEKNTSDLKTKYEKKKRGFVFLFCIFFFKGNIIVECCVLYHFLLVEILRFFQ